MLEDFDTLRIWKLTETITWDENTSYLVANILKGKSWVIGIKWSSELPDLSEYTDFKIVFENWEEAILPKDIYDRLQAFLINQKTIKEIKWYKANPNSFTLFIYGIPFNNTSELFTQNKLTNLNNLEEINPWDIILLSNQSEIHLNREKVIPIEKRKFYTWIYLWNWLYLSKLWDKWICITNINELKKFYSATHTYRLSPR